MHRNYQKYKKINTDGYKKGIKNSFWSLMSICIGLTFTYLAMTNPVNDVKSKKTEVQEIVEGEDYSYVSVGVKSSNKLAPPTKENTKEKFDTDSIIEPSKIKKTKNNSINTKKTIKTSQEQ